MDSTGDQTPINSVYGETLTKVVKLPPTTFKHLDFPQWDEPVTENSTPKHLNTHIASRCVSYVSAEYVDEDLLQAYLEDFENWTESMFAKTMLDFRRLLKSTLRNGGIYTGRRFGSITTQLVQLLKSEKLQQWDEDELASTQLSSRSRFYPRYLQITGKQSNHPMIAESLEPPALSASQVPTPASTPAPSPAPALSPAPGLPPVQPEPAPAASQPIKPEPTEPEQQPVPSTA
jgi:hypothetical protein